MTLMANSELFAQCWVIKNDTVPNTFVLNFDQPRNKRRKAVRKKKKRKKKNKKWQEKIKTSSWNMKQKREREQFE